MRTPITARDIMSAPVVSVQAATPVGEIAALLRDRRIGGLPVITGGSLQGMVTQRDLIRRHEIGTDAVHEPRRWWQGTAPRDALARAYVKSHGRTACHVMTRRVRVVEAAADLAQVARAFELHAIGRAPVVEAGQVVGIVARADLVRALADQPVPAAPPSDADDEAIRRTLVEELSRQEWWNSGWGNLYVVGGVVIFKGVVESEAYRAAARVAAENIPGVRGVVDDRVTSTEAVEMVV